MPKRKVEFPSLEPFVQMGISFDGTSGQSDQADCPFCMKELAFHVNRETGQWVCSSSPEVCARSGNIVTFLDQFSELCLELTNDRHYVKLSAIRDRLPLKALKASNIFYNAYTNLWNLPIYKPNGHIADVRRWSRGKQKSRFFSLYNMHGCYNYHKLFDPKYYDWPVWICEGEWDAIAMEYVARKIKKRVIVIGMPGARVFKNDWVPGFRDRSITWWYDNDSDGVTYCAKHAEKLIGVASRQRFCIWNEGTPDGFDVRDFIKGGIIDRGITYNQMYSYLAGFIREKHPLHSEEMHDKIAKTQVVDSPSENAILDDKSFLKIERKKHDRPELDDDAYDIDILIELFENNGIQMTPYLIQALKVSLAAVLACQIPGSDPLWVFIVGAPSSGKTTILSALRNILEVYYLSSIKATQLVSGFKDRDSKQDPSLVPKLMSAGCVVFKDWTENLDMPIIEQRSLNGVMRGAYDGEVAREYGNNESRKYVGTFGAVAGVTNKIHAHNDSSMGERWLKFQLPKLSSHMLNDIMDDVMFSFSQEDSRTEILREAVKNFCNRDVDIDLSPEDLRRRIPPMYQERIKNLCILISKLRATPEYANVSGERVLVYRPTEEASFRTVKQLSKLAVMLTYVEDVDRMTKSIFQIVEKIAFDSCIGFYLEIVSVVMFKMDGGRFTYSDIQKHLNITRGMLRQKVEDMKMMKLLVRERDTETDGRPAKSWELSNSLKRSWKTVNPSRKVLKSVMQGYIRDGEEEDA